MLKVIEYSQSVLRDHWSETIIYDLRILCVIVLYLWYLIKGRVYIS